VALAQPRAELLVAVVGVPCRACDRDQLGERRRLRRHAGARGVAGGGAELELEVIGRAEAAVCRQQRVGRADA
jgi:hypothetical protein